jgi:hypothetical protein
MNVDHDQGQDDCLQGDLIHRAQASREGGRRVQVLPPLADVSELLRKEATS